jgi:putative ABC transport system permease protein
MESVLRDVLFAFRGLRRQPAFTVTAVLTIALGIGATSAIFSVVNAVLLRRCPTRRGTAARCGPTCESQRRRLPAAAGDFYDAQLTRPLIRRLCRDHVVSAPPLAMAEWRRQQVARRRPTNFFSASAPHPGGRDFIEDDGARRTAAAPRAMRPTPARNRRPACRTSRSSVTNSGAPLRRQRRDRRQTIEFGNGRAEIVGVLAPNFEILFPPGTNVDPKPEILIANRVNFETGSRNNVSLRVVARLKAGVSFEQAQSELDRLSADLRSRFPIKQTSNMNLRIEPMHDEPGGRRPSAAGLADGRGGVRVVDRVRECRQSPAGARVRARTRAGSAGGHWR